MQATDPGAPPDLRERNAGAMALTDWGPAKVALSLRDGDSVEIVAAEVRGPFAVHETLRHGRWCDWRNWSLSHLPTGLRIAVASGWKRKPDEYRAVLRELAARLEALGGDWTALIPTSDPALEGRCREMVAEFEEEWNDG